MSSSHLSYGGLFMHIILYVVIVVIVILIYDTHNRHFDSIQYPHLEVGEDVIHD